MDIVNDAVQLHFGNATHVISKYSYIYLYKYIYNMDWVRIYDENRNYVCTK